ncbi:oligoribonuclease [Bacillaceae bacterium S4-13-58]
MYKLMSHNDLDGVSCGILAKLAFGDDVQVRYHSISSLDRDVENFVEQGNKDIFLLITDLSVSEENALRLQEFYELGGMVQLIDHHKTALFLNDFNWGKVVVENEGKLTSATSLLYDYLVANEFLTPSLAISEYVELVRQYDTWEWEKNQNEKAKRLNSLFFLVSIETFEEKMLQRLTGSDSFDFDDFEKKILEMEEEKIDRYIRRKKREVTQTKIDGKYVGIVYAEQYHSELGNELGKEFPHLDYIAILNIGGKRMGFRTIHDDVDVSAVAGNYGGGGHEKASGASMNQQAYDEFVAKTFSMQPLREDAKRNRFNIKESEFGALYKNWSGDLFLIQQGSHGTWGISKNEGKLEGHHSTYDDAEKHLKKKEQAWLERDDAFVQYLMEKVKKG